MKKTRNRLVAALLAFAMAFSVSAPTVAYADGDTSATTKVLNFNNTEYTTATIQTDFVSAANGAFTVAVDDNNAVTLTLQKDYALSNYSLWILGDLTLDLNEHTLTTGSPSNAAIIVHGGFNDVSLTLENGTITSNAAKAIQLQGTATYRVQLTTSNVTVDTTSVSGSTALIMRPYSDCTINDGTQILGGQYGIEIYGDKTNSDAITETNDTATTLTVNGGTISAMGKWSGDELVSGGIALSSNGSNDNTRITINGGEITAEHGTAIYHPQVGDLTITGGTITGSMGVQYTGAGTLTVNDDSGTEPTIKAIGAYTEFPTKNAEQKDGTIVDGAALSIVSRGGGYQSGDQTIKVDISAGQFISEHNSAVAIYRIAQVGNAWTPYTKADEGAVDNYLSDISITGGTFMAAAEDENSTVSVLTIDEKASDAFSASGISGGTFSSEPDASYVASGKVVAKTDENEYEVCDPVTLTWNTKALKASGENEYSGAVTYEATSTSMSKAEQAVVDAAMSKLGTEWQIYNATVIYPTAATLADGTVGAIDGAELVATVNAQLAGTRYTFGKIQPTINIAATISGGGGYSSELTNGDLLLCDAGLAYVPDELAAVKDQDLSTPEKVQQALDDGIQKKIAADNTGAKVLASATYDIRIYKDGQEVTTLTDPVTVRLPYPTDSSGKSGTYIVAHMIAHGDKAGTIEYLTPENKDDDGLYVTLTSLSPVTAAEVTPEETKPAEEEVSKPAEGEVSKPAEDEVSKPAEGETSKPVEAEVSQPVDPGVGLAFGAATVLFTVGSSILISQWDAICTYVSSLVHA